MSEEVGTLRYSRSVIWQGGAQKVLFGLRFESPGLPGEPSGLRGSPAASEGEPSVYSILTIVPAFLRAFRHTGRVCVGVGSHRVSVNLKHAHEFYANAEKTTDGRKFCILSIAFELSECWLSCVKLKTEN